MLLVKRAERGKVSKRFQAGAARAMLRFAARDRAPLASVRLCNIASRSDQRRSVLRSPPAVCELDTATFYCSLVT